MDKLDAVLASVGARLELATTQELARKSTKKDGTWSGEVTEKEKFHTPPGLFKKSGKTIAEYLLKTADSPKQAMLRLTFYINRAGDNLSTEDHKRLEDAKRLIAAKDTSEKQ